MDGPTRYPHDSDECACVHCECAPGEDCAQNGCSCEVCGCPDALAMCACAMGDPCTLELEQIRDAAALRQLPHA